MSLYNYKAQIVNVVDADTIDVLLDLGLGIFIKERIRIYGIDAPERFTDEGKAATQFVHDLIELHGTSVQVETSKDSKGKYGRYIGIVEWIDAGVGLGTALVNNEHAVYVDY